MKRRISVAIVAALLAPGLMLSACSRGEGGAVGTSGTEKASPWVRPPMIDGVTRAGGVLIVRGAAEMVGSLDLPGARSIARAAEDDLFRLGTDEAYAQGYADGYDEGTAEASGPDVEDDE